MLYGGGLVAVGVLAHALAERIRDVRVSRTEAPRAPRASIPVVEQPAPRAATRVPKPTTKASTDGGEDVIAALVTSGYKKAVATEAAWACGPAERATVEAWIANALRRCLRGAA